jgi:hypothetical protein
MAPEQKLIQLKDDWVQSHTKRLDPVRVEIRFNKAIEYIRHHYAHPDYVVTDKACSFDKPDILLTDTLEFRISPTPIEKSEYFGNRLAYKWACEVYGQTLNSLRIHLSETHSKPSTESGMIRDHANEADRLISEWVDKEYLETRNIIAEIIESLESNNNADQIIIFEIPTARTVTIHMPFSFEGNTKNWDEIKNNPYHIFQDTYGSDAITIFFDENDNIIDTWWSGWIE